MSSESITFSSKSPQGLKFEKHAIAVLKEKEDISKFNENVQFSIFEERCGVKRICLE